MTVVTCYGCYTGQQCVYAVAQRHVELQIITHGVHMTLILLYQKLKLKKDSVVLQRSNVFKRCTVYTFCCLVAQNGHNLSVGVDKVVDRCY